MKKNNYLYAVTAYLLLLTPAAFAQSDHSVEWIVSGVPNINGLQLDVNIGTKFVAVNGVFTGTLGGPHVPVVGTCYSRTNDLFCSIQLGAGSTSFLSLTTSLSGTFVSVNAAGTVVERGTLTLRSVR